MNEVKVTKDSEETIELFVEDGFRGWGSYNKRDKTLWTNTNDITTNQLDIAMVKKLQEMGYKVKDWNGRGFLPVEETNGIYKDLRKARVRGIRYEHEVPSEIVLGFGKKRWIVKVGKIELEVRK